MQSLRCPLFLQCECVVVFGGWVSSTLFGRPGLQGDSKTSEPEVATRLSTQELFDLKSIVGAERIV